MFAALHRAQGEGAQMLPGLAGEALAAAKLLPDALEVRLLIERPVLGRRIGARARELAVEDAGDDAGLAELPLAPAVVQQAAVEARAFAAGAHPQDQVVVLRRGQALIVTADGPGVRGAHHHRGMRDGGRPLQRGPELLVGESRPLAAVADDPCGVNHEVLPAEQAELRIVLERLQRYRQAIGSRYIVRVEDCDKLAPRGLNAGVARA